jgi:hypothetical protein
MTIWSAELHPGLRERRRSVTETRARSLPELLVALARLGLLGGLSFAVGLVAIVALRSFGWAAGLAASVGGPMLVANVGAWLDAS